jgi:hypothetical protein
MPSRATIKISGPVLDYLRAHHIITIGTSSFTGMPHAATSAYVNDADGVYFSMSSDERTLGNIDANHYASFTIDDYTPDFHKVRELRGVGYSERVTDLTVLDTVSLLFKEKLPGITSADMSVHVIAPIEVHFVDFEYSAGVEVPRESSIVYQASPEHAMLQPAAISTQLTTLQFEPGEIIVHQGERSERFFIIIEGEIEVRREGHGQDVIVTRHGTGQLFGEVGALTGAPQTATFVAVQPSTVLAVDRSSLEEVMSQSAAADLRQRVQATLDKMDRPNM